VFVERAALVQYFKDKDIVSISKHFSSFTVMEQYIYFHQIVCTSFLSINNKSAIMIKVNVSTSMLPLF